MVAEAGRALSETNEKIENSRCLRVLRVGSGHQQWGNQERDSRCYLVV